MTKKAFKKSELTHTHTSAESTRLVELDQDEITQLKGQLVPLIQVISGPEQGKIINLKEHVTFVVGRSSACELSIPDTSCSRKHAQFQIDQENNVLLEDLGSTNGTKINGKRIAKVTVLQDGDMLDFGDHTRVKFSVSLEKDAEMQMDVFHRATRDPLTNAYNRRSFEEALDRELAFINRGQGQDQGLGLIIFDVDHFKKVNDTYGHPAGDLVLTRIGMRAPGLLRKEDIFARIGGEEFAVLTRNESLEKLKALGERIREDLASLDFEYEERSFQITVSVGISYMSPNQGRLGKDALFKMADEALYEAKNSGRNRVCVKTPLQSIEEL